MLKKYQFKDEEFVSAHDKDLILKAWDKFLKHGCKPEHFTDRLYKHLSLHCSFIAHYDRSRFYAAYFNNPSDTLHFLTQFDPTGAMESIEYGATYWQTYPGGNGINSAMCDVAGEYIPMLKEGLKARQIKNAESDLIVAQSRLRALKGE